MSDKKKLFDEVKLLYVNYCEEYQAWQKVRTASGESQDAEVKLNELKKITQDFEQKAQELFSSAIRGTYDYKRSAIILAHAWNAKLEWLCKVPECTQEAIELIEKILNHLDPFKEDLMGMYPYLFVCVVYYLNYQVFVDSYDTAGKVSAFMFKTGCNPNLRQALNGAKLFGISAVEQSVDFIQYQEARDIPVLFELIGKTAKNNLNERKSSAKQDQKGIPDKLKMASKMLKSSDFKENLDGIFILIEAYEVCMCTRQFKQMLHILSVAMHNLVKMRQSLPMNMRSQLNEVQAILSNGFAHYGYGIVTGSMAEKYVPLEKVMVANFEYTEMTDLIEPELETYSSQFPTEHVDDIVQLKKVLKKAMAWNKRAIELGAGDQSHMKEYQHLGKVLSEVKGTIDSLIERENKKKQ